MSQHLILFILALGYCTSSNNSDLARIFGKLHVSESLSDSLPKPRKNGSSLENQSQRLHERITTSSVLEILTMQKTFDSSSKFYTKFAKECDRWSLTKKDIKAILHESAEIDGQEVHYFFEQLPCSYSGQILIDGKPAIYRINSGGSSLISYKDTSIYFGYKKENHKNFFIVGYRSE